MPPIKRQMLTYPPEAMTAAIEEVRNGVPVATAAKKHKIPRITLMDKVKGKTPLKRKMGPPTILTSTEENLLVEWILSSASARFMITKRHLLDSVQIIMKQLKRKTPFTDSRPGERWYVNFLRRHSGLSERLSQNFIASRTAAKKLGLKNWFEAVTKYLSDKSQLHILQHPSRVYSAEQTTLDFPESNPKVPNKEKEYTTVFLTSNAEGTFAPPMIVYKCNKDNIEGYPEEWAMGKSDNGWMNGELFLEYMINTFHPWLQRNNIQMPIIFFINGLELITLHTSLFCSENEIILVALHPNSTHILQPLYVGFFKPMKTMWKQEINKCRIENFKSPFMRKLDFSAALNKTLNTLDKTIIKNAFRKCGLFPWDKSAFVYSKLAAKEQERLAQVNMRVPIPSCAVKVSDREGLSFLEKEIGEEKLNQFQHCSGDWTGAECDMSLFKIWRTITNRVALTSKLNLNCLNSDTEQSDSGTQDLVDSQIEDIIIDVPPSDFTFRDDEE